MLLQRPIVGAETLSRELSEGIFCVTYKPGNQLSDSSTAPPSLRTEATTRAQIPSGAHVASVLVKVAHDGSAEEHWVLFPRFVSPLRELGDALVIERVRPIDAAPTLSEREPVEMDPKVFLAAMRARAKKEGATYTYLKVRVNKPARLG